MKLADMIESFMKDDNRAFEYIFRECGSYCLQRLMSHRKCAKEVAEDLFADALLIFRSKILSGQIDFLTSIKAYMYRICDNNYLASVKKETTKNKLNRDIIDIFYTDDETALDPKLGEATRLSWNLLSEKCKDIIYLFYVETIKMEEIAKILGLANADTAKSTKSRCYKKLIENAKSNIEF